jgi:hypothetical protein
MGASSVLHDVRYWCGTDGELMFLRLHANRRIIEPGVQHGGIRIPAKGQRRFGDHIFQIF